MRLIDADALPFCPVNILHDGGIYKAVVVLSEDIGKAPTIEAEPVRHGRWVVDDLGHTFCSKCNERIPYIHCYSDEPDTDYDEEWDEEWDEEMPETLYCPNCGAKMDGGAE